MNHLSIKMKSHLSICKSDFYKIGLNVSVPLVFAIVCKLLRVLNTVRRLITPRYKRSSFGLEYFALVCKFKSLNFSKQRAKL